MFNTTVSVEKLERIIEDQIAELRANYNEISYETFKRKEREILGMVMLLSKASGEHYMFSVSDGLRGCGYEESN